jgi:hypothetical protein
VHEAFDLAYISEAKPQWLSSVQANYESDPIAQVMLTKLSLASDAFPHFTLKNGILRYKSRLWIGNVPSLHNHLISVMHDSALGGHSGSCDIQETETELCIERNETGCAEIHG